MICVEEMHRGCRDGGVEEMHRGYRDGGVEEMHRLLALKSCKFRSCVTFSNQLKLGENGIEGARLACFFKSALRCATVVVTVAFLYDNSF
jgi:hypothetical protein